MLNIPIDFCIIFHPVCLLIWTTRLFCAIKSKNIFYSFIPDSTEEREIMETCYIYVTSDPYFHTLWSWQSMIDILPNLSCKKAKWFAIETISELCSIGQLGKKDLLRKLNDKSAEGDLIEK